MRKKIILLLALTVLLSTAYAKEFTISFGNGGFKEYSVKDNSCYVYVLNYPKDEKKLSEIINRAIITSLFRARKQFSKNYDGFINITTHLHFIGKEKIIYQVCGDIVRRK